MLTKQIVQEGVSKVSEVVITCEDNGVEISALMGDLIEKRKCIGDFPLRRSFPVSIQATCISSMY